MSVMIAFAIFLFLLGWYLFELLYAARCLFIGKKLAEQTQPFSRTLSEDKARAHVLFFGDSTVVGTGASSPEYSVPGLVADCYPDVSIENKGRNGMRIEEAEWHFQEVEREHYDLIVLQLGGNDVVFLADLEASANDIDAFIAILAKRADTVLVTHGGNAGTILALPRGLGFRTWFERRTKRLRNAYKKSAKRHKNVFFVDLFVSRAEWKEWDAKPLYARDRFHPSDEGYTIWLEYMLPTIKKALGEPTKKKR